MVFVYNPEGRSSSDKTGKITYWFAKQDPKRVLQEEMDYLQKHHLQRVQTEEKTLMHLIRPYLG